MFVLYIRKKMIFINIFKKYLNIYIKKYNLIIE